MKKLVAVLLTFLLILTGCNTVKVTKIKDEEQQDAIKFSSEYKKVDKDNIYKYVTYDTVVDTVKNKTGIIYLGYPSCIYCKEITPILNDISKEKQLKTIYYYNFKDIRKENTKEYKELTNLLKDYIGEDEDGIKKISAPTILFVKKGEVKEVFTGSFTEIEKETDEISEENKIIIKENFKKYIDEIYNN